jgi:hypothetical protein
MSKRVKRVHISGWLDLFMTEPIAEAIARHLDTRNLFRFLLGVSKALRERATRSPRWNRIMEYKTRLKRDLGIPHPYTENQNILEKFLKRLYGKTICSFCFKMVDGIRKRPGCPGLRVCYTCGVKRKLVMSDEELAVMFIHHPDVYLVLFLNPWRDEMDSFLPCLGKYDELRGRNNCVVDYNGRRLWL